MTGAAPTREEILARVPALAAEIGKDAARRELAGKLPFEAFALVRESGFPTLRVPSTLGGPGGSIVDYIGALATLASGDPNVAHALRSHFNFVESAILAASDAKRRDQIGLILDGKIFAGAHTEQGTLKPGDVTAQFTRVGETFRLNGRKWYATGTAFADFGAFSAIDEDGQPVSLLVPTRREGLRILDDWDGMGQRLTASGGVVFDNVEIFPHEVERRQLSTFIGRHTSALRQLHLAACAVGVLRNVLSDGIDYVRGHGRSAAHSAAPTAAADPFVQQVIGEIAANSFAVDRVLLAAASKLDATAEAIVAGDEAEIEAALIAAALAVAETQLLLGQLGPRTAERLFELGGGSATSRAHNFDRHWRNIRTVLSHNPLLHKSRVVGDYLLNGVTTHLMEGKVF
jgi:alkylation response protein AidB-like acyl-CoA dehydrogenase